MRRWLAGTAMLLAVALSGCSVLPSGVDGNITDDWGSQPAGVQFQPKAGSCYKVPVKEQDSTRDTNVVPCTASHYGETVHVGQFTGKAAELTGPPLLDQVSAEARSAQETAFTECDRQANLYLGHSWYSFQLYLNVVLPSSTAWTGGVRWYRCDLYQEDWNNNSPILRTASLKTEWLKPLCMQYTDKKSTAVDCSTKHNAEDAGGFAFTTAQAPKKSGDASWNPIHDRCMRVVAGYVGVSSSTANGQYSDVAWTMYDRDTWSGGRRVMRCLLWLGKSTTAKSAKASGGKGIPRWS